MKGGIKMAIRGVYLLETRWVWDHSNIEFATITIEEPDHGFEELLDIPCDPKAKDFLTGILNRIFEAQCPSHGSREMVRLYRIVGKYPDIETRDDGDKYLKISMKPPFDFNKKGEPVPFKKE